MSSKKVRAFMLLFAVLILLCIIWSFILEDKMGENYTFVLLFEPFVFLLPLSICTAGILLGLISFFFENKSRNKLQISSIVIISTGILCSIVTLIVIGVCSNQEKNIQKNIATEEKYQIQNFVSTPDLVEDKQYSIYYGSNYIVLGKSFAYHTEKEYNSSSDDMFNLEISAYEFENIPPLFTHKLQSYLIDEFFRWRVRIGYYEGKKVTGESNGKKYTYYLSVHEDEKRDYSYFAILVEREDAISLLMLSTYYTDNYGIDIQNIIEKMCAD